MCTSPLYIRNNSLRFIPNFHKVLREVPCGKCDSCRENLQQDWLVRSYTELKYYNSIGGRNIFVTLTYNNHCLPYLDYSLSKEFRIEGKQFSWRVPCFSPSDKDRFLNSFRQWFLRKGVDNIHFLWACEYGKDPKGTRRPHYHVLLHIPPCDVSTSEICKKIESLWTYEKNGKRYRLGFVLWSDYGVEVQCNYAAAYVGKYISKDIGYFEQPIVQEFLDPSLPCYDERKNALKPFEPRHWQSKGYGANLFDVFNLDKVTALKDGFRLTADSDKIFRVPRYNASKLLYLSNKQKRVLGFDSRQWLSDFGLQYYSDTFNEQINNFAYQAKKVTTDLYLSQYLSNADCKNMPSRMRNSIGGDLSSLMMYVHKLFRTSHGDSLYTALALYKKVWQNTVSISAEDELYLSQVNPYSSAFYNFSYDKYLNGLYITPSDYPLVEFDTEGRRNEFTPLCKDFNRYHHYLSNRNNYNIVFDKFDEMIETLTYLGTLSISKKLTALFEGRKRRRQRKRDRLNRENNYLKN